MATLKRKPLLLVILWILVTFGFLVSLLMLDISRQRENLKLESSVIYEHAYERTLINEVLLNNFVELVENDLSDTLAIRRYSRDMREHYPHISHFLLYQRVSHEEVPAFESRQSLRGLHPFRLRVLDEQLREQPLQSAEQPFYYPVVFVEPLNKQTEKLLGLDGFSHPANRVAMMQASYYLDVFASDLYPLISGDMGYRLFHAIDPALAGDADEGHLIASIVLKAREMLPPPRHVKDSLQLSLLNGEGERLSGYAAKRDSSWLGRLFLPQLSDTRHISRFGQSLVIVVERQLLWRDVNWLVGLVILVFSLLAFVLTLQNYIRKKEAQAELENLNQKLLVERDLLEERVQERTWELVKTNTELREQVRQNRSLTQTVLRIQEQERRNIARELHDEMGQSLTAIRTDAQLLKKATEQEPQSVGFQAAKSIDGIAQRIYGVTYGLMRSLRPAALDDLGLADALKECISNSHLEAAGIQLHQALQGAINELSEEINISCYRLLQETLNNAIKHSGASVIWLTVRREEGDDDRLYISIKDNGCGFDLADDREGFGLIGMRERVYALGGDFKVTTAPGEGTHIEASLPVS